MHLQAKSITYILKWLIIGSAIGILAGTSSAAIGGILVALATELVGNTKYICLGIPSIVSAFHHQLPPWDFVTKIGFTALTLGSGFKGGEVTPLFYIGATLGNADPIR